MPPGEKDFARQGTRRYTIMKIIFKLFKHSLLKHLIDLLTWKEGRKAFSFGKSRARMYKGEGKKITFDDVAGLKEEKEELLQKIKRKFFK